MQCKNFTDLAWLLVRVDADHVQGTLMQCKKPSWVTDMQASHRGPLYLHAFPGNMQGSLCIESLMTFLHGH